MRYADSFRLLRVTPLALAVSLCLPAGARAATILVNDASAASVPGKCSLPDAVAALNTAQAVNACAAGDGNNDTISLGAFQSATTIAFDAATSADGKSAIAFVNNATLVGPLGSDGKPLVTITRSTAPGVPKFRIIDSVAHLTVKGLAISGGDSDDHGAGIAQTSTTYEYLHLIDSVVSGNTSSVSGGGVSIDCSTLIVTNSTISGNTSQVNGGGIYSSSTQYVYPCYTTIALRRSTISNNTALRSGGGIFEFAGIINAQYSTLDGNSALSGGAIYGYGHVDLVNATVSGNHATLSSGAIYAGIGASYLFFATVSGNICDDPNAVGGMTTQFFKGIGSIVSGNTGQNLAAALSPVSMTPLYQIYGNNNIIGAAPTPNSATQTLDCDPLLGALADNGGPTRTMNLGSGSCAIDAGPAVAPPISISNQPSRTDQRGAHFLRKFGSATDIGAVEAQPDERVFFDGFDTDYSFIYYPNRPGSRGAPTISGSGG